MCQVGAEMGNNNCEIVIGNDFRCPMIFAMYPKAIALDKGVMSALKWGKSECNDDVLQMTSAVRFRR